MTLNEKIQLVKLLHIYQDEQIEASLNNVIEVEANKALGRYERNNVKFGTKASYTHARIISDKLSREIEEELPSYWEL